MHCPLKTAYKHFPKLFCEQCTLVVGMEDLSAKVCRLKPYGKRGKPTETKTIVVILPPIGETW